jgi:CheY-like chemotaxis protein
MYQAAQQGAQMIRKLSVFSRRRGSGQRLASLQGALSTEIARVQKSWLPTVVLKVDLPSHLPDVAVDGESLRLLLEQVLDNARESIRGEGVVTLSVRQIALDQETCWNYHGSPAIGPAVEIVVSDTGGGISPDIQKRLFHEVFVTSKPGRRGLGLAMVYGILQANQAGLQLETNGAGGTSVRMVLPQAPPPVALPERRPRASARCRERILIVDDDPLILQMIAAVLGQDGYRVHRAAGGAEALRLYHAAPEPFELVLSDLMMAGTSGFDLARKLQESHPAVNIMFITGHAPAKPLLEDRAFRTIPLLAKPFRADALLKLVRATLDRGTARTSAIPALAADLPKQAFAICSR